MPPKLSRSDASEVEINWVQRVTIQQKDIQLARRLRGERV